MKLVRFGEAGRERPGIWLDDGRILDVRAMAFHIEDYNEHFFSCHGLEQLRHLIQDPGIRYVKAEGLRLGSPVARPSKIICVGANYADHAKEFGHKVPQEPILFSKATSAMTGPHDPICLPENAEAVDAEAELAVVIGRMAARVKRHEAMDYVAGFTVLNDVTERVVQKNNGQWFCGKGFDTFCPVGPYLVTADEVEKPEELRVWQKLNGKTLQDGIASDMIFTIPYLIEFITRGMTLLPGDIIATGTPSGIGSARNPQVLMQPGDTVEVGVEGLGRQCAVVV